jgi:hypothetical protein
MPNFQTYIFNLLPPYFKVTDSYKDVNGKGLLERFLEALGKEWDDNLTPKIANVSRVYTDTKFINHQSKLKGGIPQGPLSDVFYEKLVKNWIYLLKIKGTKLCYEKVFRLYNPTFEVSIVEHFLVANPRDIGPYTRDDALAFRDATCKNCIDYEVHITYTGAIDLEQTQADVAFILSLFEPLNVKLTLTTIGPLFVTQDDYEFSGDETVNIIVNGVSLPTYNQTF